MNIAFYTRESPYGSLPVGGAETSLKLLAECLADSGHTVVFISDSKASSFFGFSRKKVKGLTVITHTRFSIPIFNSYAFKKLSKPIKERYLKNTLKKHAIEVVHTYYNVESCLYFLKIRNEIPYKVVVRIAGMKPFEVSDRRPHFRAKYKEMFQKVDLLNFISEGLYKMYLEKGSKIGFNPNYNRSFVKDIGVALQPNGMWNQKNDNVKFHCIMVSRFTKYAKRQDILVNALALLSDDIPLQLTLIGSGPNASEIEALINRLQLASKITIVDFLPQEELQRRLLDASLLCHACDHEGLSKIIIESMGMGIPVLASDVAPLNTYIEDANNGFLVENTPEAWANKLTKIYADRNNLTEISNGAATFVRKNYDATKNVEVYEHEFQKLIS